MAMYVAVVLEVFNMIWVFSWLASVFRRDSVSSMGCSSGATYTRFIM